MGPEARIPCPICRGPIHPVAGRCKHCKTDLVAVREGKPQAQTALPSLGNRTSNDRPVQGPRGRVGSGRAAMPTTHSRASFSMGSAVPSNRVVEARPKGSGHGPESEISPGWPLVVIAISSLAIVLSVGVLASQLR